MREPKDSRQEASYRAFRLVMVGVALGVIVGVTVWAAHLADRKLRRELLLQAELVANGINLKSVAALSGTVADLALPQHQRLKEQLSAIRLADPRYRYLYLMGRRPGGEVFFYVEAMPEEEETPEDVPGVLYEESSEELLAAFDKGTAFTEGPLADEWGVWVSALVSLTDPESGAVVAVLGIDIDAKAWRREVAFYAAFPSIVAAIAVLLALNTVLLWRSRRDIRARKAELEDSESRFAQLAEQSRSFVWEVDAQGLYVHASSAAWKILGYRPEELVGQRHFFDLHPEEGREEFRRTVMERFARREILSNLENPMVTREGRGIWVTTNAIPVMNADGTLRGYRGSDMDITERKRAEDALVKRCVHETLVADACALLLSHPERSEEGTLLDAALGLLLKASSAHRAYVFENRDDPVDGLCMEQTHEACAEGIAPQIGNPRLRHLSYQEEVPRWREELAAGRCIQGRVAEFPAGERALLEPQGIVSLLAIPIRGGGEWRGFIGFDYDAPGRDWDEDDVKLLRTAAEVIGGFMHAAELRATLRSEWDRYERTVALLTDNVWTFELDADFHFVDSYIAPSMDQMLGLPPGSIGSRFEGFLAHVHPEDRGRVVDALRVAKDGGQSRGDVEYRVLDREGGCRWFLSKGAVYGKPNGNIIVYGTTSDITERRKAEEELRENETRFAQLAEQSRTIIWEVDAQGVFQFVSPTVETVLGYRPEELVGRRRFFELLPGRDRERIQGHAARMFARMEPCANLEFAVVAKDGREVWISCNAIPVRNADGTLRGYRGSHMDVTDRKHAEEALRGTNLQLESAVERAHQLAKEAQEASLAKGRFLMQMSHEIRTPMNAVLGMADMLEESPLEPDQRNFLRILQSAGNHLLGVIDDILDYSRLESRSVRLEDQPFDLHQLAEKSAQLIAVKALEKALEIAYSVAPDVPRCVRGDERRLRQAIINLMGNAVKFTEKGSVCLVLERGEGDRLRVTVRDTGIGIPQDQLGRIFQRFYQTDLSLARRYGGTGLGLTITREIVELMGGEIQVASEVGQGSVFTMLLPLREADPACLRGGGDAEAGGAGGGARLPSLSLLLAEDLEVNRDMVRYFLREHPVEIVEAVNGREAVEQCARRRFDLVLMDVEMPEMDGIAATRRIREEERKAGVPPVPIFALTAHAMAELADQCREAGVQRVITKPVRKKALVEAIRTGTGHAADVWAQAGGAPASSRRSEGTKASIEPSAEPVDVARLIREFDGDAELAMQMLHSFLETLSSQRGELRAALEVPDLERARRCAHAIRGAAANLAADPLARAAGALETAALAADPAACRRRLPGLEQACDALSKHVARSTPPQAMEVRR